MFELKSLKTFIVRTLLNPDRPLGEQEIIFETYVACMVCTVVEFQAAQGKMTMIHADHAQVAVTGSFYELEEIVGAKFLG